MKSLQVVKAMSYPRGGYETRHLVPGDVFTARSERDHRLLLATKKVQEVRDPVELPAPPPDVAAKIAAAVAPVPPVTPPAPAAVGAMTAGQGNATPPASDDRAALRTEYEKVLGKAPFPGWSADVLREKIAAAKGE